MRNDGANPVVPMLPTSPVRRLVECDAGRARTRALFVPSDLQPVMEDEPRRTPAVADGDEDLTRAIVASLTLARQVPTVGEVSGDATVPGRSPAQVEDLARILVTPDDAFLVPAGLL